MKILITGSEGFVGKELVKQFIEQGHSVFGIDRVKKINNTYQYINFDLREKFEYDVKNWDVVIHCAAAKGDWGISDSEFHLDNVAVTENLINYLKQCTFSRLIHFSTVAIYDRNVVNGDEGTLINPDSIYGSTKLESEILIKQFANERKDLQTVILRPSVIYGRNNYANMYNLINQLNRKIPFQVKTQKIVKSHVSVNNVVNVVDWFTNSKGHFPGIEIYNLTERPYLSLEDINTIICDELSVKKPFINVPQQYVKIIFRIMEVIGLLIRKDTGFTAERLDKYISSTDYSSEKLWNAIGNQKFTSESQLRDMVKWFKELK